MEAKWRPQNVKFEKQIETVHAAIHESKYGLQNDKTKGNDGRMQCLDVLKPQ
jgi:hypothetical protein